MPLWWALVPLLVLVACFAICAITVGLDAEALILSLLVAATAAGLLAVGRGHNFKDIQHSTGEKLAAVLPVLLILLAIGGLIGSWVLSGTIPYLVALGIEWVQPQHFVLTAFLMTALMSLCTGTSWGSAGTLGVALVAAAEALHLPLAPTAGAIVSGAYFGDKMSPLSDSTNICALGAGADLYSHIRHMLYTAVPSFVLSIAVFATFTGGAAGGATAKTARLVEDLHVVFELHPVVLLPLVIVVLGVLLRRPPVLVLGVSAWTALLIGIFVQGFGFEDGVHAFVSGFDPSMVEPLGAETWKPGELFLNLVSRGGLYSMSNVLVVVLAAFLLAAGMDVSGALDTILEALLAGVRSTFGLMAAAMTAGAAIISLTSHGGVTALIVGGMFQSAFKQRGLAPENLSRSLEDSVTVVEPLLPWTVSAIFMSTTLGVPTLEYFPWAVFCMGGPVFSLFWALTSNRFGFAIKKLG